MGIMIGSAFMVKKIKGGFLIAIEGIDGAGKTTQVKELKKQLELKGFEVASFKEPTNSKFGNIIRNIAMHNNEHLNGRSPEKENEFFIEDRKIDVKKNIKPSLNKGKIVIMDRYFYSNMAYQSVLGLDIDKIKKQNEEIAPIPDVFFILDITPQLGISRITFKRGETTNTFEKSEYLEKVRDIFNSMADYPNVKIIEGDCNRKVQDITTEILNITLELINRKLNEENDRDCEIKGIERKQTKILYA